jgi:hypothetical protein
MIINKYNIIMVNGRGELISLYDSIYYNFRNTDNYEEKIKLYNLLNEICADLLMQFSNEFFHAIFLEYLDKYQNI